jgi:protein-tyrosine phosphatase
MKIMFICTGNICRSAMSEAMLKKMVKEQNKNIEIYSCGTYADNGDVATNEAIQTMQRYNVDLTNHRATNITKSKIKEMDLILCATLNHKNMVIKMFPELAPKTFTMKEYAGYPQNDLDISDPWGYGINVYEECAKEISDCLNVIIDKIN